jgi:hypothetical protein
MDPIVDVALEARLRTHQFLFSPAYAAYIVSIVTTQIEEDHISPEEQEALRRSHNHTTLDKLVMGGETYAVGQDCTTLINEASKSFPTDLLLTEDLIPGPGGWIWFDQPILGVSNAENEGERLRAISWQRVHTGEDPGPERVPGELDYPWIGGIAFCAWFEHPIVLQVYPGALIPSGIALWPFGQRHSVNYTHTIEERRRVAMIFAAFCIFVHQRLLVAGRQAASRGQRRRLENQKTQVIEPIVNVIELRVREYARSQNPEHRDVDWQVRWIVRGHLRNQWYPSLGIHQPKFVFPYPKGPKDKPLKGGVGARVFAVVR